MACGMPSLGRLAWVLLAALAVMAGPCSGGARPPQAPKLRLAYTSTNRVIVRFKAGHGPSSTPGEAMGLAYSHSTDDEQGTAVYTIRDSGTAEDKIIKLRAMSMVEYAEPDYKVWAAKEPNDASARFQWHHAALGMASAWNLTTGSGKVKVCIVDSGIAAGHEDLSANYQEGWNLVPDVQRDGHEPPARGTASYANATDTFGHGTHIAGIVGAVGNNRRGVAGVNWKVKVLACRFLWDDTSGFISDAIACLKLCRKAGANIVVGSWGGMPTYSEALYSAFREAGDAGQLLVVAGTNDGLDLGLEPSYPASFDLDNMITVGATDQDGGLAAYSNYGSVVHVTAPGTNILSTTHNGLYGGMTGTSMAAPIVAGAAALLQALALGAGAPALTALELKALLLNTTDAHLPEDAGKTAHGRLNVSRAVTALRAQLELAPVTRVVEVAERGCKGWPAAPCTAKPACNAYQAIVSVDAPAFGKLSRRCNATNSYRVVAAACLGKASCVLTASARAFGRDPCPKQQKSLTLSYTCGPKSGRPPPPAAPPPSPPLAAAGRKMLSEEEGGARRSQQEVSSSSRTLNASRRQRDASGSALGSSRKIAQE